MRTTLKTLFVKARMKYADIRGHHGKRWDYEPGDWYMGQHKKKKQTNNMVGKIIMGTLGILSLIILLSIILNYLQGGI
jgi:hypothetical protein